MLFVSCKDWTSGGYRGAIWATAPLKSTKVALLKMVCTIQKTTYQTKSE